jgi:hypothetical protein
MKKIVAVYIWVVSFSLAAFLPMPLQASDCISLMATLGSVSNPLETYEKALLKLVIEHNALDPKMLELILKSPAPLNPMDLSPERLTTQLQNAYKTLFAMIFQDMGKISADDWRSVRDKIKDLIDGAVKSAQHRQEAKSETRSIFVAKELAKFNSFNTSKQTTAPAVRPFQTKDGRMYLGLFGIPQGDNPDLTKHAVLNLQTGQRRNFDIQISDYSPKEEAIDFYETTDGRVIVGFRGRQDDQWRGFDAETGIEIRDSLFSDARRVEYVKNGYSTFLVSEKEAWAYGNGFANRQLVVTDIAGDRGEIFKEEVPSEFVLENGAVDVFKSKLFFDGQDRYLAVGNSNATYIYSGNQRKRYESPFMNREGEGFFKGGDGKVYFVTTEIYQSKENMGDVIHVINVTDGTVKKHEFRADPVAPYYIQLQQVISLGKGAPYLLMDETRAGFRRSLYLVAVDTGFRFEVNLNSYPPVNGGGPFVQGYRYVNTWQIPDGRLETLLLWDPELIQRGLNDLVKVQIYGPE